LAEDGELSAAARGAVSEEGGDREVEVESEIDIDGPRQRRDRRVPSALWVPCRQASFIAEEESRVIARETQDADEEEDGDMKAVAIAVLSEAI